MSTLPPISSSQSQSQSNAAASSSFRASLPKGAQLDSRTQALLRLQASRERIQRSMRPGHEGPVWHWLEHPFRFISRWWRSIAPIFMGAAWPHAAAGAAKGAPRPASSGESGPAGPGGTAASLHEAGEAAFTSAQSWVREHPVAGVSLAAVIGALLIGKRGALWGLLLGVGQGVMRQGQGWVLRRLTDPAIYMAIIAALAAQSTQSTESGAEPKAPEGEDEKAA